MEKSTWGLKVKLDVKKPIIGLAAHPTDGQLLVLFQDGGLRSYAIAAGDLAPVYALPGALTSATARTSHALQRCLLAV